MRLPGIGQRRRRYRAGCYEVSGCGQHHRIGPDCWPPAPAVQHQQLRTVVEFQMLVTVQRKNNEQLDPKQSCTVKLCS
ncbi:unnamed protein product [Urochloa humidicola]